MSIMLCCLLVAFQGDADAEKNKKPPKPAPPVVAARVNGVSIIVSEVNREAAAALGQQKASAAARRVILAATLQKLVDQQLALRFFQEAELAANKAEVEREIEQIKEKLARKEITFERYLDKAGLTRERLAGTLRWQLSWRRFLERYMSEKNVRKYFDRNKPHFDGTKLRVAHILLKPANGESTADLRRRAETLRQEIVKDKKPFAEVARRHSQSPSAKDGGDIGFIERREPMPESFSKAAFDLKANEVSRPIVSSFGVHLIRVLEVKPGQKRLSDVRGELRKAVAQYLFRWAADQARDKSSIQFTGASPYFKAGGERQVVEGVEWRSK